MKHALLAALLGTAILSAPASALHPPPPFPPAPISRALQPAALPATPRFGKFEASWTLPAQAGNPFDPRDNNIEVAFDGPHGLHAVVPAFWDGDRWRVRFAPPLTGRYTLQVRRSGHASPALGLTASTFRCTASAAAGFVHVALTPLPHFVFGNGRTYYPLGMNVAWTGGDEPSYPALLPLLGGSGLNWARIWMNHWDGKNLDWAQDKARNPPRGFLLLDAARKWDAIFDSAARSGVYVQMTLQHHGQYTAHVDPNWADNPWNTANGGFLHAPADFFTDTQARRLTRAKYRYIVARWGYSTHLLAFELFNEVQNITETQAHPADVVAWHREMAAYLRSLDINHHLVTTSNSDPGTPLARIGLDYDQVHAYPPDMVSYFAAFHPSAPVPVFAGEWGYDDAATLGVKRAFLHAGLWAGIMAPTAGAGQFWYGDAVVKNDWWPEFGSAASFVRTFHVAGIPSRFALTARADAPGPRADLVCAPPGGWGPTTRPLVPLLPDGAAPDLSGVSAYVQGRAHRDLLPGPIVFSLACARPTLVRLDLGIVAASGAHPTLSLDSRLVGEHEFPATARDHEAECSLSLLVPPGAHQVAVFNTGADWVVLRRLVAAGYGPPVSALARGTDRSAVFWARAQFPAAPTAGATVLLPALRPGAYQVRLWDIARARSLPPVRAHATKAGLRIALPPFRRDIAGVAVRL